MKVKWVGDILFQQILLHNYWFLYFLRTWILRQYLREISHPKWNYLETENEAFEEKIEKITAQNALDLSFQSKYKFVPSSSVANRFYYVFTVPEKNKYSWLLKVSGWKHIFMLVVIDLMENKGHVLGFWSECKRWRSL